MNRRATAAIVFILLVIAVGAGLASVLRQKRSEKPLKALGFIDRPETFIMDIAKSEGLYDVVNKAIKGTFVKGLRDGDPALARKALSADFLARFPAPTDGHIVPDVSLDIREFDKSPQVDLAAEPFLALIRSYTAEWVHLERTTWRPFLFLADPSESAAYCELHFQLAGPLPDTRRVDLSGTARAQLVLEGGNWKLRRFEWIEGTRIEGRQPPWREITDDVGLHFNESDDVAKVKQQVIDGRESTWSVSPSVLDYNQDGFWDILAGIGYQESVLFINDGRGGFERQPTPARDVSSMPSTWLVLDLDGDGVSEWVTSYVNAYSAGKGWFDLYHKKGTEWERLDRALEFPNPREDRVIGVTGILPVDINRDGLMDLYFCG
ncbi:MAG: VCBS repeat-containing protein, partial [Planctomycetes bacterium]|nr:VCBS repeat-containing protein [Planctomycetota bacterium]